MFILQLEIPKEAYSTFMIKTIQFLLTLELNSHKKLLAFFTKMAQFSYFLIKKINKGEKIKVCFLFFLKICNLMHICKHMTKFVT